MVFKTDGNGRVKLTEEEKETFASEGLPLPSRIPLTKVITRVAPRNIISQRKYVLGYFQITSISKNPKWVSYNSQSPNENIILWYFLTNNDTFSLK